MSTPAAVVESSLSRNGEDILLGDRDPFHSACIEGEKHALANSGLVQYGEPAKWLPDAVIVTFRGGQITLRHPPYSLDMTDTETPGLALH